MLVAGQPENYFKIFELKTWDAGEFNRESFYKICHLFPSILPILFTVMQKLLIYTDLLNKL